MHSSANVFLQEKLEGFAPSQFANNSRNSSYFKFTAGGKHLTLHLRNAKQVR